MGKKGRGKKTRKGSKPKGHTAAGVAEPTATHQHAPPNAWLPSLLNIDLEQQLPKLLDPVLLSAMHENPAKYLNSIPRQVEVVQVPVRDIHRLLLEAAGISHETYERALLDSAEAEDSLRDMVQAVAQQIQDGGADHSGPAVDPLAAATASASAAMGTSSASSVAPDAATAATAADVVEADASSTGVDKSTHITASHVLNLPSMDSLTLSEPLSELRKRSHTLDPPDDVLEQLDEPYAPETPQMPDLFNDADYLYLVLPRQTSMTYGTIEDQTDLIVNWLYRSPETTNEYRWRQICPGLKAIHKRILTLAPLIEAKEKVLSVRAEFTVMLHGKFRQLNAVSDPQRHQRRLEFVEVMCLWVVVDQYLEITDRRINVFNKDLESVSTLARRMQDSISEMSSQITQHEKDLESIDVMELKALQMQINLLQEGQRSKKAVPPLQGALYQQRKDNLAAKIKACRGKIRTLRDKYQRTLRILVRTRQKLSAQEDMKQRLLQLQAQCQVMMRENPEGAQLQQQLFEAHQQGRAQLERANVQAAAKEQALVDSVWQALAKCEAADASAGSTTSKSAAEAAAPPRPAAASSNDSQFPADVAAAMSEMLSAAQVEAQAQAVLDQAAAVAAAAAAEQSSRLSIFEKMDLRPIAMFEKQESDDLDRLLEEHAAKIEERSQLFDLLREAAYSDPILRVVRRCLKARIEEVVKICRIADIRQKLMLERALAERSRAVAEDLLRQEEEARMRERDRLEAKAEAARKRVEEKQQAEQRARQQLEDLDRRIRQQQQEAEEQRKEQEREALRKREAAILEQEEEARRLFEEQRRLELETHAAQVASTTATEDVAASEVVAPDSASDRVHAIKASDSSVPEGPEAPNLEVGEAEAAASSEGRVSKSKRRRANRRKQRQQERAAAVAGARAGDARAENARAEDARAISEPNPSASAPIPASLPAPEALSLPPLKTGPEVAAASSHELNPRPAPEPAAADIASGTQMQVKPVKASNPVAASLAFPTLVPTPTAVSLPPHSATSARGLPTSTPTSDSHQAFLNSPSIFGTSQMGANPPGFAAVSPALSAEVWGGDGFESSSDRLMPFGSEVGFGSFGSAPSSSLGFDPGMDHWSSMLDERAPEFVPKAQFTSLPPSAAPGVASNGRSSAGAGAFASPWGLERPVGEPAMSAYGAGAGAATAAAAATWSTPTYDGFGAIAGASGLAYPGGLDADDPSSYDLEMEKEAARVLDS
ncbi:uncharacterized protein MONBRDRAFT_24691 [Monosiga brevicollis MX1]|uniref:Uncharacterized protein n=1 Tax=Monosiga brevicollis TaxID=81824 RepID=A9UX67_MONBE|nr:uncharacterized protein MONBRDRAFT_24691 [Monosiga brevicollis MX1]EDQ90164.1 predicted protein [Monosiga brevicollis MX1]|eukprot:XP_001744931.1 hypothetical protein [Monosiga brevicollis MX1]